MRSILDSRTKRHVQIIEYLSFTDYGDVHDLMIITDASDKTILKDLDYINEQWGDILGFNRERDRYFITEKTIASMHRIFRSLFSNSLPIIFTLNIFSYPFKSMKFHSKALHVSESSLYRLIPSLNEFLQTMNLSVDNKQGLYHLNAKNECHARHFITALFLETQYIDDIMKDKERKALDEIFRVFHSTYNLLLDETELTFYKLYYKLSLIREIQGFKGTFSSNLGVDKAYSIIASTNNKLQIKHIKPVHGSLIEMLIPKESNDKEIRVLKQSLISNLHLELNEEDSRKLYLLCADAFTYINFYPYRVASLFDRYAYFSLGFQKENLKVFSIIEETITQFAKQSSPIYNLAIDYFVYYLNVYFYDQLVEAQAVSIGIVSELGKEHSDFLSKFIKNHFTFCTVESIDIIPLTFSRKHENFDRKDFDIVLSTAHLENLASHQYFLINDLPNTLDLSRINRAIQSVYGRK